MTNNLLCLTHGSKNGVQTHHLLGAIARQRKIRHIDLGLASTEQIGEHARTSRRHGPAERAVTSVQVQAGHRGGAHDRRAVGRHRAQAGPRLSAGQIHRTGKQLCDHVPQCGYAVRVQRAVQVGQLPEATHANLVAETRDGHLVVRVEHGAARRLLCVGDGQRERVALHRVDGQLEADCARQLHAANARSQHHRVSEQRLSVGETHANHRRLRLAGPLCAQQRTHRTPEAQLRAPSLALCRHRLREAQAVARLVVGQVQAAAEQTAPHRQREAGLQPQALLGGEHCVRHIAFAQHRSVERRRGRRLRRLAVVQFERAERLVVVVWPAELGVHGGHHRARTVLGEATHAALIELEARWRAFAQQ
mmetsp:Transcript_41496/g.104654  ORF Transcript_41496/g.104654 Transcript_41496/m.104654 type:complete len:363 (+) Transcript_41496:1045-2133(+)